MRSSFTTKWHECMSHADRDAWSARRIAAISTACCRSYSTVSIATVSSLVAMTSCYSYSSWWGFPDDS